MRVLFESFKILKNTPVIFLPKIASVTLSSLWILGLILSIGSIEFYIASYPFIIVISLFISIMLADMATKDEINLRKSFVEAEKNITTILKFTMLFIIGSFVLSIPLLLGILSYLLWNQITLLAIGGITTSVLIGLSAFFLYFLPITILKNAGVRDSISDSFKTSYTNSREVVALLLFSFGLLVLASVSQGYVRQIGILGFLFGRLIESIVSTYIFVISPRYYISKKAD